MGVTFIDLSVKRPQHMNPAHLALAQLKIGKEYVHDHSTYKTRFCTWIAQLRSRLGRNFRYRRMVGGKYAIRVEPDTT